MSFEVIFFRVVESAASNCSLALFYKFVSRLFVLKDFYRFFRFFLICAYKSSNDLVRC